jgi:predicted dehydrogenase
MAKQRVEHRSDRREFLKESAGGLGAFALGAGYLPTGGRAANDRIGIGILGAGSRGGTLMQWLARLEQTHNVEITAVCDLIPRKREQAQLKVKEKTGRLPHAFENPRQLFAAADVDAVVIATADFQHCHYAAEAAKAGKDVYVEKPFGSDFEQVRLAYDAIQKTDRIVQLGTQSRGSGKYYEAARFVQAGMLGKVTYVEISEPIFQQRWRIDGAEKSPSVGEIDWQEFLCYLPSDTPFDARHYREFRLFSPYSTGPFCQWLSHRIDLVNLVLGERPCSAVALGGVFLWNDGRNNPDTMSCLLEYPSGVLVSYHMRTGNSHHGRGTTFYGTAGTLELETGLAYGDGGGGVVQPQDVDGELTFTVDKSRRLKAKKEGGFKLESPADIDYLGHFIDCIRSRKEPRGNLEAAFDQSVATLLAATAYRSGQKMVYDPLSRSIRPFA